MALALAVLLFLTIAMVVFSFGAAAYAPSSVLGSRLAFARWAESAPQQKPAFKERVGAGARSSQQSHSVIALRSFARPRNG